MKQLAGRLGSWNAGKPQDNYAFQHPGLPASSLLANNH
jgi:hypothetical protein